MTARSTTSWQALDPRKKNRLLCTLTAYRQASGSLFDWTLARRLIDGHPFSFEGHDYLRGIYRDESALVVIRKAAQMGASEYAISRALHFAVTRGGRVIYFFPSDNDVGEFSRDRFAPAVAESDYLTGLVRDTDTFIPLYKRARLARQAGADVPATSASADQSAGNIDEAAATDTVAVSSAPAES